MCSIVGKFEGTQEEIGRMLKTMEHRAPDGFRIGGDKKLGLGMGRLAIIDIKSENLCLYQENGIFLSFNGEIYNYIELKRELEQRGWHFKTTSDTEVLMKSWREWGVKCLDRFNGMFAFAIYDGKEVFLARDIAGEKPLYYKENPFQFASEAKALGFDCKEFPPATYAHFNLRTK